MKNETKNKEQGKHQTYASPRVKVITTSVQRVICTSVNDYNDPFEDCENL